MIRSLLPAFALAATLGLLGAAGISYASAAEPRQASEWAPIGLSLGGAEIAAAQPEQARPAPVDQAGWAARKQRVRLPNGIELAYVELGNPAGRPVLLLHGYTDSSRVWSIVAPWLADYRLLIPDQRGHGASSAPDCCYAMSEFANDARLFLDALDVDRASIVGSSMGSMVAQVFAAEYPGRVDRIALAGSTALVPVRRGDWLWTNTSRLRTPISSNVEFLREFSPSASPTPVDPVFVRHFDAEMAAVAPHVWRAVMRELLDVPIGRYAADINADVLILSGGRDPLFPPDHHRALVQAYPRAEAHVFADLGHNLVVERPHEVGPVLAAFLRR
jgi:pimeloyl-ACP methyl ester carboxylesterase